MRLFYFIAIGWFGGLSMSALGATKAQWVIKRENKLPLTAVQFTFRTGTSSDPKGLEGITSLTAVLWQDGGVKAWKGMPARDRAQIEEYFSEKGASVHVSVDKEQTSLRVLAPANEADGVVRLATQMLLAPAFEESQVKRNLKESEEALRVQWPREDQEELGKAFLDSVMYGESHPYAHVEEGKTDSLKNINRAAIEKYYRDHFSLDRLTIGMAGKISPTLKSWVEKSVSGLTKQLGPEFHLPEPTVSSVPELVLVKGDFQGTGVHLGLPIPVNRAHPDFPALYLAATAFGKHRSFVGRLMRVVREERGLNYGAYSYAENFPEGGRNLIPPTGVARTYQAFTLWGRPTRPENGCFLLRQMWRELNSLVTTGLTPKEFSLAQSHLVGSIPELALSLDRQLGYGVDGKFYGIKSDPLLGLQRAISKLDAKTVNAVVAKYVQPQRMKIVVTTADPEAFKTAILGDTCAITYGEGIKKSEEVLAEDKEIGKIKLPLSAETIRVKEANSIF